MPKYLTAETYLISVPDNIKDEPHRNFLKVFDADKTRMIDGEKNYDDMLSRFHLIQDTVNSEQCNQ